MTPRSSFQQLTVIVFLLLTACSLPGAPEPTAAPIPPTATPAGTPTPIPTTRPFPTVTPYSVPESQDGLFISEDGRLSIRYTGAWRESDGDPANGIVRWFIGPDGIVFTALFISQTPDDASLEDLASQTLEAFQKELQEPGLAMNEQITLANGRPAWRSAIVGTNVDGQYLRYDLVTTMRGDQVVQLMIMLPPDEYEFYERPINAFINELNQHPARVFGIPPHEILRLAGGEADNPRLYDPATAGSASRMIFGGLVMFDANMQLQPDLAQRWDIHNGTVYTFHLRPEARFHNGRPVTAADIVYSWERAADPATESDTVLTYLGDIVGVRERREGQADRIAGLRVIDESTLEVTIDAPKPYFLMKLTFPTAFVVDRENIAAGPEWYRTPNGTGPYRLIRWERQKYRLYERHPNYHLDKPAIPYVIEQIFAGVGVRMYESGEIDVTGISVYDVPRFSDPAEPLHAELYSNADMCTEFLRFDVSRPPFDDPNVRLAFAMAFDQQQYIDLLSSGYAIPARGLYPPALPGYSASLEGVRYNPAMAQKFLQASRYGGPEGLPPIVYTIGGMGGGASDYAGLTAQMWSTTLGVSITIEKLEPDHYQDELFAGNHGNIIHYGWCADYPDPENFADLLFHSDAKYNLGNYANEELDTLLEQARVEQDPDKRIRMYKQAEQIIVKDAAAIFISHSVSYALIKPHLRGFTLTPFAVTLWSNLSIDSQKLNE